MRNLLDATPKALHEEVHKRVRAILDAPEMKTARLLKDEFVAEYAERAPKAVRGLEDGFDDVTAALGSARSLPGVDCGPQTVWSG